MNEDGTEYTGCLGSCSDILCNLISTPLVLILVAIVGVVVVGPLLLSDLSSPTDANYLLNVKTATPTPMPTIDPRPMGISENENGCLGLGGLLPLIVYILRRGR